MMQGRCDVTKTGETKELGGLEKPVGQEQSGQSAGGRRMVPEEAGEVGGSHAQTRIGTLSKGL